MSIYKQSDGSLIVEFDTYIENTYHNANNVAYEPLENGSFSSDSKQDTPFIVSMTGAKSIDPDLNNPITPAKQSVDECKTRLENLAASAELVIVILQPMINRTKSDPTSAYNQYGKIYQSLCLLSIDYQNTPEQLEFRPNLIFQQIRLTDTEYSSVQNTANPDNGPVQNKGQVQPDSSFDFSKNSILLKGFGG